ncbi:MAG: thiamine-phosphate kinase [Gammaproteobacteria bacterium]
MDERTLISTCFDRRRSSGSAGRSDVVLGIGDDAAILRVDPGFELLVATDSIAEGTHFPAGIPAAAVGHRCLAVNLSDMAAMAAEPLWYSLALSLPEAKAEWVSDFARGLFALGDRFGVELVGGDTVRGPLGATVTIHGRARPGEAVLRTGAAPGDGVWVTGSPGDAVAGRMLLPEPAAGAAAEALRGRFLYPEPRVLEGRALAGIATAMLDLSDGLDDDLRKLLAASGVGAEMDAGALPLSAELRSFRAGAAVGCALTGGDDYELCFTVRPADEQRLRDLAGSWTVPVTRIGTIVPGAGCSWRLDGQLVAVPDTTYRHF